MIDKENRLPAEWEEQSYIQLTWPHPDTDWKDTLEEVEQCYYKIAEEIAKRQPLLIVSPEFPKCLKDMPYRDNIIHVQCDTNDTWARDHAFITTLSPEGIPQLMDFQFNGWGMKYPADKDNRINSQLHDKGILKGIYFDCRDFVLEGGSIESDGKGTILTTESCLLSPNRNDTLSKAEIEERLMIYFGAKQVIWIENAYLQGDDTDGHIDTLARFCPRDTILYVECKDHDDIHFSTMRKMALELFKATTLDGKPFRMLPLPLPSPIYDDTGQRLPATYANFLVMNKAVLVPTYVQPENDKSAMTTIGIAFPDREIIGIDCRPLIRQHGSLHCATMQYPSKVKN